MAQTFTREEVINKLNILLEQHAPSLMDAITNEHTDFDGEELLILAEQTNKPMAIDLTKLEKKFIDLFANVTQEEFEKWLLTKNKPMAQQTDVSKIETTQTAVEWLLEQAVSMDLGGGIRIKVPISQDIIEQAKQMEMEQMEKAYKQPLFSDCQTFDQYYNKTYGK